MHATRAVGLSHPIHKRILLLGHLQWRRLDGRWEKNPCRYVRILAKPGNKASIHAYVCAGAPPFIPCMQPIRWLDPCIYLVLAPYLAPQLAPGVVVMDGSLDILP
jgi:hypothetical protein